MRQYKIKESLCNLKQAFEDLKDKFAILIETLDEMHLEDDE